MHLAAARGDAEMLRWLLDRGARAGVTCVRSRTPLHCAAASGAVPCVEALLSAGADAGACDADGEPPPPICVL
jgi:ankyrin repeat protein